MEEIHSLMSGTLHHEEMNLTDKQWNEYWLTFDENGDGNCYVSSVPAIMKTYDIWRYEKVNNEHTKAIFDTDKTKF